MESPVVPAAVAAALLGSGYRVGGPAGVGGGGPVWTATRVGAADPGAPQRLVVQVLPVPDDAARTRLAARLEALWALDHPHLPPVVDVVAVPAGDGGPGGPGGEVWAVLLAEVPGATVAALLAARGRLSAGEVVTLAVPVAGALDGLHRSGLVHGDVSPANVVVRPDGRPVLIDVLGGVAAGGPGEVPRGTPGFVAPEVAAGTPASPPADVYALAGVALAALDLAQHHGRLGDELRAACTGEPVRRPTAAELAAALYACAEPQPITQPDAGVLARTALAQLAAPSRTVSVPTGARHRAHHRRLSGTVRGLAAAGVVAAAATAGIAWTVGDSPDPPPPVTAPHRTTAPAAAGAPTRGPQGHRAGASAPARPDPVAAAVALTRRRAEVLASGVPDRLAEVVRAGSPAYRADRALVDRLAADGITLDGVAAVVDRAWLLPADGARAAAGTPDVVDVRVRSGLTGHERRSPSGTTAVPARPARDVVLRLVWTDAGWRVAEVRPG